MRWRKAGSESPRSVKRSVLHDGPHTGRKARTRRPQERPAGGAGRALGPNGTRAHWTRSKCTPRTNLSPRGFPGGTPTAVAGAFGPPSSHRVLWQAGGLGRTQSPRLLPLHPGGGLGSTPGPRFQPLFHPGFCWAPRQAGEESPKP